MLKRRVWERPGEAGRGWAHTARAYTQVCLTPDPLLSTTRLGMTNTFHFKSQVQLTGNATRGLHCEKESEAIFRFNRQEHEID